MASVFDGAKYILKKQGPMTAIKLQKLVYYCQAWSLVWDEKPLFQARIEAWANGPVVPRLYQAHRGEYKVNCGTIGAKGDIRKLTQEEKETIDAVLKYYGKKQSQWLSELTHLEPPWLNARKGLSPRDRGNKVITPDAMAEYYGSLI